MKSEVESERLIAEVSTISSRAEAASNRVVISQPMYFPWIGILEQVRLASEFVHYEDVQFSKGGFSNRVQVKTKKCMRWLTVPLRNHSLGQKINEVEVDYRTDWQTSHRDILRQAYAESEHRADMLDLVDCVFSHAYQSLAELSKASMMSLIRYFGLEEGRSFIDSPELGIAGSSSQRVIDICSRLKASRYVTGHGAKNYLDHKAFEAQGIEVDYIEYGLHPYNQLHGPFTPYVTALDLVANCGKDGAQHITGKQIHWRKFIAMQNEN
ncbi:MAG: Uncharacterised protein [Gammaproteobacteria bacterium]|nr:MAG: Uncharacterised protein [Gammaproteobacteria bacterium]